MGSEMCIRDSTTAVVVVAVVIRANAVAAPQGLAPPLVLLDVIMVVDQPEKGSSPSYQG